MFPGKRHIPNHFLIPYVRIDRQDVILVVSAKDQLSPGRGIQPFDAPFLKSIGINDRNHIDVAQIVPAIRVRLGDVPLTRVGDISF